MRDDGFELFSGQSEDGAHRQNHGCAPDSHGEWRDDFVGCSQDDFSADLDLLA